MPRVPAFCPTCYLLFPSGLVVAEGGSVGLFDSVTNCPRCGGEANFANGIYEAAGNILKITQDPNFKTELLAGLAGIFHNPVESDEELEKAAEAAEKIHPGFGELVRLAYKKKMWAVFAAFLYAVSQCSANINFDVSLNANQLFDQIQQIGSENLDRPQQNKGPSNPGATGKSPKKK